MAYPCERRHLEWSEIPDIPVDEMSLIELVGGYFLLVVYFKSLYIVLEIFGTQDPMQTLRGESTLLVQIQISQLRVAGGALREQVMAFDHISLLELNKSYAMLDRY